jgi:hypothetical protein
MSTDALLDKLDGVKGTGPRRWLAKCPAHDDRSPSLSVRELDDGRVLVHDFAGCDVGDVLAAVGLTFDDLFPPRTDKHFARGELRPFPAADVLRAVEREALIVAVAASRISNGGEFTQEDRERLLLASSRLTAAMQESGHA